MPSDTGIRLAPASISVYQQDVLAGEGDAVGHRQHRQPGAGVVVAAVAGQRPEMGRRPQEDDEEQDQRLIADTWPVIAAQPSTGGMAPEAPPMTMFIGVAGFKDQRVDDGVADEGGQCQPHRQVVDEGVQQPKAGGAEQGGQGDRFEGRDLAAAAVARQLVRAMRASTVRSTRQLRAAAAKATSAMPSEATRKRSRPAEAGGREEHADHRGEHDQAVDPRLAQVGEGGQALARVDRCEGTAMVCMSAGLLTGPGEFEQALEVAHALAAATSAG